MIYFDEKTINTLLVTCTIIIKLSLYKSNKKLIFILLVINKYYATNSMKYFFSLLIINKYYPTNSIKPFVTIQFIILNVCRQLLFSLCITNYHINTAIK